MIMAMFDKYITRKSFHVILQNFEPCLKRTIGVSKSFERVFVKYGINLPCTTTYILLYVVFTLKTPPCLSIFLYFSLFVLFVSFTWKLIKRFTPSSLLILQSTF